MNNQKSLNIAITGQDEKGKELVGTLIQRTLVDHGFTNVAMVNTVGEPTVASSFESIYDAVQASNPGLFNEPVRIWGSVPDQEAEGDMPTVAVNSPPDDADQQFVSDAIEADAATEAAETV